jgi:hypothetical protein
MLKRILILVLLYTIESHTEAQDTFVPSTLVGVHGGINFSTVGFKPSMKQEMLLSNAFGIVVRHVSEPHIGIQLEANFAGKGWKEVLDTSGSYTRELKTIDIPVTAVFIAGSRLLRFSFALGPYVSYLRKEKEIISVTDADLYKSHYGIKLVNDWEFGFTGGLSVEFHTGIGAFALRGMYSHALTNLFPLNVEDYYFSVSRNQVIHVGLMYFYTFAGRQ